MRLRFDKTHPDFVIANEVFFETKHKAILAGKFYAEDDVYKFKYDDSYLEHNQVTALSPDLPLFDTVFESKELFQPIKHYLSVCSKHRYCLANEHFSRTKNIFFQLPFLEDLFRGKFRFEPVYKTPYVIDDVELIIKYFDVWAKEFVQIIDWNYRLFMGTKLENTYHDQLLWRIHDLLLSKENFYTRYEDRLRILHSSRKKEFLKKIDSFFSSKYIAWDK